MPFNLIGNRVISFHGQLNAARRFNLKSKKWKLELGIKTEYIAAPYRASVQITEQPPTGSPTNAAFQFKDVYRLLGYGFLAGVYLGK